MIRRTVHVARNLRSPSRNERSFSPEYVLGGDALAQHFRGVVGSQSRGTDKGGHRQAMRLLTRKYHLHAGIRHSFDEIKHIGRARARQRRDRVELGFFLHPEEHPVAPAARSTRVLSSAMTTVTARRGYSAIMLFPTRTGVLGMALKMRSVASQCAMLR